MAVTPPPGAGLPAAPVRQRSLGWRLVWATLVFCVLFILASVMALTWSAWNAGLARMDADAMKEAWHALQTTGQTSVRAARARKTGEPVKEEKQPDTPFQKAERALWIAVKALETAETKLTKDEVEKLLSIKKTLDKVVAGLK